MTELLNSALGLAVAFVLGTLIGAERQYRQRTAGLRTNVLVAIGASAFVDIGMRLTGTAGAVQVTAYVVSGVGFLGAGVIMKEGLNIRGLNTAATLWCSAAVGAFAGTRLLGEAILLTAAVLAGNTLLRPLINFINRAPLDERKSEATYEVRVTTADANVMSARELVVEALEAAHYPVGDIETEEREDGVEIVATLVSTAIEPVEIEAVIRSLKAAPSVRDASWTVRTSD
ncbi:MAG: MgtC/SapB family protein [Hyphomicrobiales bacterium]|nr:MgtC/SapB family protein [Hyphomicrobiales bacterium]MBV8426894.1 MgtC/SapB family protein [Hyphomicrobiales bacterium]MBV8765182.1 MgtC/SapB family protein [Hyphomicrobiales bacterium]MBV9431682.1 MgtC/SapB family protein [Hyphomicrobiales bacterium]MBV9738599.1 MgtC/SapB family protein [Hyphomicrobiales bacterium]